MIKLPFLKKKNPLAEVLKGSKSSGVLKEFDAAKALEIVQRAEAECLSKKK